MTRLFDAPHGQIHELEKRLQAAGFTAEHLKMLLADDPRLRRWVAMLDENIEPEPPQTRVPIEPAFGGKGRIMHQLLRMKFLYLNEVAELTEREFLNVTYFGPTSLRKVKGVLSQHGLKFSEIYSEPSVLVDDDRGWQCYYRPRVMMVELSSLILFDYGDWLDRDNQTGGMTLGVFVSMSEEQQARTLSETGLAKAKALIARLQL